MGDSESRISLDLRCMKPPWPWMDSVCDECVRTSPLSVMEAKDALLAFLAMICCESPMSRTTSPVV